MPKKETIDILKKCESCGVLIVSSTGKHTECPQCRRGETPKKSRPRTVKLLSNKKTEDISSVEDPDHYRPSTRGECPTYRPCPYVGCRYNLYLDVKYNGNITFNRPDIFPEEMPCDRSCALDMADEDEVSVNDIAEVFGLNPERVRQMIDSAMDKCRVALAEEGTTDAYK